MFIYFCITTQSLNCQISKLPFWKYDNFVFQGSSFCPKKKEYAKLAIPLTGSKGQALRVFEKNLHRAGSIFSKKP
jgi:hypothetical protein